jgi:hypothetical protein
MRGGRDVRVEVGVIVFTASLVWLSWPGGRAAVAAGAVCALFLVGLTRLVAEAAALRPPRESEFDDAMARPRSERPRPEDLQRAERVFGWKRYSAEDFEHRIRPLLERLVRAEVVARGGADPADDPDAAEALSRTLRAVVTGEAANGTFDTRRLDDIVEEIEALR